MTTLQKIKVMQAFVDGRKVEAKLKCAGGQWREIECDVWNWEQYEYRVKPQTIWVNEYDWGGKWSGYAFLEEQTACDEASNTTIRRAVKYQEVIE